LKLILESISFKFNNIIYKQKFGTPMGSPLSSIIAEIVSSIVTRVLDHYVLVSGGGVRVSDVTRVGV